MIPKDKTIQASDLVDAVESVVKRGSPTKRARTLYLSDGPFKVFQKMCDKRGVKPAQVIDEWITAYIEKAKP